jgi:alpha-D-xyloside xylohydrolase
MVARRELRVRLMAAPGQAEQSRTLTYQGQALTLNFDPASKNA